MSEEIMTKEIQEKVMEAEKMLVVYQDYKIETPQAYTSAGEDFKKVKMKSKELTEMRLSMTRPLDLSKSKIMDFFKKPLDILSRIENNIALSMQNFQLEQKKKSEIKEERLRKLAEAEAKELERRAKNAKGAEKKAELLQRAEEVKNITPVVAVEVPAVKGIASRTTWKYKIINVDLIPREYLIPNEVMLGQIARAEKGNREISGVKFYSEESMGGSR